jgi:hypothetical protein
VGEARFSAPFHTGPGAHPAYHTMGTGSFLGVKRPGLGVNHPPPCSAEVKERVELYLYSPSVPSWKVIGRILPYYPLRNLKVRYHLHTNLSIVPNPEPDEYNPISHTLFL